MFYFFSSLGLRCLFLSLCIAISSWQLYLVQTQPTKYFPKQIDISVLPGGAIQLGKDSLASPLADLQHVLIKHSNSGNWQIANISQNKKVEIKRHQQDVVLRSIPLKARMKIGIENALLNIEHASSGQLKLRLINGQKIEKNLTYDGTKLISGSTIACPDRRISHTMRMRWNSIMPKWLSVDLPIKLGGLVDCDQNIALPEIEKGGVTISRDETNNFVLKALSSQIRLCMRPKDHGCTEGYSLFEKTESLNDVQSLVIGRTHYKVEINNHLLRLKPIKGVALFQSSTPPVMQDVNWQMQAYDYWKTPFKVDLTGLSVMALIVIVSLFVITGFINWRYPYQSKWAYFGISFGLMLFTVSLLLYVCMPHVGISWLVILFGLIYLLCLSLPISRLSMISLGTAILMSQIGLASLLALGLTRVDTEATKSFQSNSIVFCIGFSLITLVCLRSTLSSKLSHLKIEWGLYLLSAFALFTLLIQFVLGDETGVFGFQPVEIAKFSLILLTAHVLAIRLDWQQYKNIKHWLSLWLTFLHPVLVFIGLATISLVMVHDYSPFLLILCFSFSVVFAWLICTERIFSIVVILAITFGAFNYFSTGLYELTQTMAQIIPYSDRVDAWLSPELHPHTGAQFYQATHLIQQGGVFGQSNAFGWSVPAVQDDFAPSWLMARFGATGAGLLTLIQAFHICSLLALGWFQLGSNQGDFRAVWASRFKFFALWGSAGMLLGHYLISWGTNLGWMPVMGQPMPYISYGGSLILFLLTPIQVLALQHSPRNE